MPRQPRLDAPNTLHHVMVRGIERTAVFRGHADRTDFVGRLADLVAEGVWTVHAWALLPNHAHLLLRTAAAPLAVGMRRLLTGYVVNFNRRHHRTGHLFQNRYRSIVVEEEPYLLELVRYIHLNPIRAGVVSGLGALDRYPWSGHSALVGTVTRPWQATETILGQFAPSVSCARAAYRAFVAAGLAQGRRAEFQGGGLLRSVGGWAEVRALRQAGTPAASDARILGSGAFVERLLADADATTRATLRLHRPRPPLDALVQQIAAAASVPVADLQAGRRTRAANRARQLLCQLAVRRLGYPGAMVARALGVTTSAVNRAAWSAPLPDVATFS